jgi:hypothetical protein
MSGEVVLTGFETDVILEGVKLLSQTAQAATTVAAEAGVLAISGACIGINLIAHVSGTVAREITGEAEKGRREAAKKAEQVVFQKRQAAMAQIEESERKAAEILKKSLLPVGEETSLASASPPSKAAGKPTVRELLENLEKRLLAQSQQKGSAKTGGFHALEKDVKAIRGRLKKGEFVSQREIEGLVHAFSTLAERYSNEENRRDRLASELKTMLLACIAEIHTCSEIPGVSRRFPEILALQAAFDQLIHGETLDLTRLTNLKEDWAKLQMNVDSFIHMRLYRHRLIQSTRQQFSELGYQLLEDFPPTISEHAGEAVFRIPGGELLRIHCDESCQLHFLVIHETTGDEMAFPLERLAAFRAQEKRFCGDVKSVSQRLEAEGFRLSTRSEIELPSAEIEIATVETAQEVKAHADSAVKPSSQKNRGIKFRPKKAKRKMPC